MMVVLEHPDRCLHWRSTLCTVKTQKMQCNDRKGNARVGVSNNRKQNRLLLCVLCFCVGNVVPPPDPPQQPLLQRQTDGRQKGNRVLLFCCILLLYNENKA